MHSCDKCDEQILREFSMERMYAIENLITDLQNRVTSHLVRDF